MSFEKNNKIKKIAILGFGLTGRQMTDYFLERGDFVTVIDDNIINVDNRYQNNDKINFILAPKKRINFDIYDDVLLSPSFRLEKDYIVSSNNYENFHTELDYFYPYFKDKMIISVTGTNGKTSTVKLLTEILQKLGNRVFLGGNVGIPLVNYFKDEYDIIILELSSFQLFYTKNFKTDYSILLSLAEDHLTWHKDFDEYVESKLKLIDMTKNISYVHTDFYEYLENSSRDRGIRYYHLTLGLSNLIHNKPVLIYDNVTIHKTEKLDIDKRPFRENFIPIQDILYNSGLEDEDEFIELINSVKWEKYRLTREEIETNLFINDSKSTNIDSTAFALKN
jgi:UDP-N-acetylmuramoylalanine--D-glutamate ligase